MDVSTLSWGLSELPKVSHKFEAGPGTELIYSESQDSTVNTTPSFLSLEGIEYSGPNPAKHLRGCLPLNVSSSICFDSTVHMLKIKHVHKCFAEVELNI